MSIALTPPLGMKFLQQAEAAERAEHDRAAAEERGPAPEPARSFRLPQQLIPDLLVLWELLADACAHPAGMPASTLLHLQPCAGAA